MSKFEELWRNYPEKSLIKAKCQNKQASGVRPFGNYCAIMLSEALIKSGVPTVNAKAAKCWGHSGMKHILLAEEMANWLKLSDFSWLGKLQKINPASFQNELSDKTGIIFFKDYWPRGSESFENRSGDHIDLWDKDRITSSSMLARGVLEFFGRVSDLNQSREIWFWEVQ